MPDDFSELIRKIQQAGWWQGSVFSGSKITHALADGNREIEWWVIASQTCNLYNPKLDTVPVFEVVGARIVESCSGTFSKGDHPRVLQVEAQGTDKTVALEIDIQKRAWLPRELLASIGAPEFRIHDHVQASKTDWIKNQWLDIFSGWIARSYTRITLPDGFNELLRQSRIEKILNTKLTRFPEKLYGIYFSISRDDEDESSSVLGLMPPPYLLEIMLVTHDDVDPKAIVDDLNHKLFVDTINIENRSDGNGNIVKLTRGDYAKELGLKLIKESVIGKTISEVSLREIKSHIRYSIVDYLSDSSSAAPV